MEFLYEKRFSLGICVVYHIILRFCLRYCVRRNIMAILYCGHMTREMISFCLSSEDAMKIEMSFSSPSCLIMSQDATTNISLLKFNMSQILFGLRIMLHSGLSKVSQPAYSLFTQTLMSLLCVKSCRLIWRCNLYVLEEIF